MSYKYISTRGREYNLYYSDVTLRGGKSAKVYFLLPLGKTPNSKMSYLAKSLPETHEIREIGENKIPLVYRIRKDN